MSGGTDEAVQHIEKLLEQCPQVTGGAVDMLQAWCEDPAKVKKGMTLLKQLIVQCHYRCTTSSARTTLAGHSAEQAALRRIFRSTLGGKLTVFEYSP